MESRLAATARVSFRAFSGSVSRHQFLPRGLATAFIPTRHIADPAIHSSEASDRSDAEEAITAQKQTEHKHIKENDPFATVKPPYASSPKLESTGVNQPIDPIIQQKRRQTTTIGRAPVEDVSCTGLDGTPWPEEEKEDRRRQEGEYKEYNSHHKASPLSEIEVVDTRKPITRATDGTADSHADFLNASDEVVLWREEQLDTAEDSLRRAMEMWKQSAIRGIPDSPHGRVLRALRSEDW
ncbi:hypothetical protein CsSME_00039867 [Camellia sinensis var. sinensis]